ncbi:MAG: hypothetical protein V4547_18325 [Bacteroidota bacterium]
MKAQLIVTQNAEGTIELEFGGEDNTIAVMLAHAMVENKELAAIVCGAIPTFLDAAKIDRAQYCSTVLQAKGLKK